MAISGEIQERISQDLKAWDEEISIREYVKFMHEMYPAVVEQTLTEAKTRTSFDLIFRMRKEIKEYVKMLGDRNVDNVLEIARMRAMSKILDIVLSGRLDQEMDIIKLKKKEQEIKNGAYERYVEE